MVRSLDRAFPFRLSDFVPSHLINRRTISLPRRPKSLSYSTNTWASKPSPFSLLQCRSLFCSLRSMHSSQYLNGSSVTNVSISLKYQRTFSLFSHKPAATSLSASSTCLTTPRIVSSALLTKQIATSLHWQLAT